MQHCFKPSLQNIFDMMKNDISQCGFSLENLCIADAKSHNALTLRRVRGETIRETSG